MQFDGRPGAGTVKLTGSDVAQSISASILTYSGYQCKGAIITVEDNPVRISFVSDADQSTALGHQLNVGDSWRIYGESLISELTYINANNGENCVLQFTPLY